MKKRVKFINSLTFAWRGIKYCLKKERHMRFHIMVAILVVFLGWYLQITSTEWLILLLTIILVLVLEMINTAIESVTDLVILEYHPLAETAKNVAAGAVLLAALNALIIGAVIFLPYLIV